MRSLSKLFSFPSLAACLVGLANLASASQIPSLELGDLIQTYDGNPKMPSVTVNPAGAQVQWRFVDPEAPAPGPVATRIFNRIPATLDLSYPSLSFASQKTSGFGDYVALAGTARELVSVDMAMVTWAKAASYPLLAAANPAGWTHQVSVWIYEFNNGRLVLKATVTRDIFVPWRPLTLPNGSVYPYSGFAFRAHFPFPEGLTLPDRAMVMVGYDTQNSGFNPIGAAGPYNELNVAGKNLVPRVGTDVDPLGVLWVREETWSYPTPDTPAPLFEIVAKETPPPGSASPPVDAGTYEATASIENSNPPVSASGTFVIEQAAAAVELADLAQTVGSGPKPVTVTTVPAGLPVEITYNGGNTVPDAVGSYAITATITDANHTGSATGTLVIAKALAIANLQKLAATYDGTAKPITVTTSPAGLPVEITYDGSPIAPTASGTYPVTATITDANHTGSATGTLVIAKAPATATLQNLAATYDGSSKPVIVTTDPAGLPVEITYNGSTTAPSAAGSYQVIATILNANYAGTGTAVLQISASEASFVGWQDLHFTPVQHFAGLTGPNDDPDGDGLTNFAEFALGSLPTAHTPPPAAVLNPDSLSLTFHRPKGRSGVSYHAEHSTALGSWTEVELEVIGETETTEILRARVSRPSTAGSQLLRLRFDPID